MAGPVAGDATSAHAVPARLPPGAPVLERDQGERHMPDENDRRRSRSTRPRVTVLAVPSTSRRQPAEQRSNRPNNAVSRRSELTPGVDRAEHMPDGGSCPLPRSEPDGGGGVPRGPAVAPRHVDDE